MSWQSDLAKQYDAQAQEYRSKGCFELANLRAEDAQSYRLGNDYPLPIHGVTIPLHERIHESVENPFEWDRLQSEGVALTHPRPDGPSREGSIRCESGSIASGGNKTYCTCEACW